MSDNVAIGFVLVGVIFDLLGCLGLIRLPDVYNRLQAATKSVTLGTCMILFGIFLEFGFTSGGIKALICALFILFTSPTAAHALARGSHVSGFKLWEGSVMDKLEEDKSKEDKGE
ncbi:Na+/H+ antiporter subunit G [candidate division WOR-3 bacterium]|nr:Na+/H+ antiporter subunit G [candidate division WOR-3 bacterium]MCK4526623.1 Na+/H+ antiporter subunit G [candidate division WOR-3 bacterium]